MQILVVEDDNYMRELLVKRLRRQNYTVAECAEGQRAWDLIETHAPFDGIILDIMLPGIDGLTILRRMRQMHIASPVLLLTARDTVEDRVSGLDAGADDYLVKPFSFDELDARVRALLRRGTEEKNPVLSMADLTLDTVRHTVCRAGTEIALTNKEFALLEFFLRNPERVLTREQILNHVWSYDFEGDSNIVDVYIRYLRRKIDRGYTPQLIHTVRGSGYVLRRGT